MNTLLILFNILIIILTEFYQSFKYTWRALQNVSRSVLTFDVVHSDSVVASIAERLTPLMDFRPLFWAQGGAVQTLMCEVYYNLFKQRVLKDECVPCKRTVLTSDDDQAIVLEWMTCNTAPSTVIVFFPGIGGSTSACYLQPWYPVLKERGIDGVVMNRRGYLSEHPIDPATAKRLPSYADLEDVRLAMRAIRNHYPPYVKLIGIAYSAGGTHMLKYAAQEDNIFDGVVAISTCYDITRMIDLLRASPASDFVLNFAVQQMYRKNREAYMPHLGTHFGKIALDVESILDNDARLVKKHGHDSLYSYYAACSCVEDMKRIKVPTLCITSLDDPLLPGQDVAQDVMECMNVNPNIISIVTDRGGHVSWIQDNHMPWIIDVCNAFVDAL
jgi:predicted alpha/beta-fold hydrolase